MPPAITYNHFHDVPTANRCATIAGPMIAPTAKNPSTAFMVAVCSIVDLLISPIRASAPVLKMPIAAPEMSRRTRKKPKDRPTANR